MSAKKSAKRPAAAASADADDGDWFLEPQGAHLLFSFALSAPLPFSFLCLYTLFISLHNRIHISLPSPYLSFFVVISPSLLLLLPVIVEHVFTAALSFLEQHAVAGACFSSAAAYLPQPIVRRCSPLPLMVTRGGDQIPLEKKATADRSLLPPPFHPHLPRPLLLFPGVAHTIPYPLPLLVPHLSSQRGPSFLHAPPFKARLNNSLTSAPFPPHSRRRRRRQGRGARAGGRRKAQQEKGKAQPARPKGIPHRHRTQALVAPTLPLAHSRSIALALNPLVATRAVRHAVPALLSSPACSTRQSTRSAASSLGRERVARERCSGSSL